LSPGACNIQPFPPPQNVPVPHALVRLLIALPAFLWIGCVSMASGNSPGGLSDNSSQHPTDPAHCCAERTFPSRFDFVVFASIADASDLVAMFGYDPISARSHAQTNRAYPTLD
jgi:hypothetical protein